MLRLLKVGYLIIKYFLINLFITTTDVNRKAKLLREFFEETGGAFIKFGQLLALRVDALPQEYFFEMVNLFDHVKAFSYKEVERIFLEEFGVRPTDIFSYFEKEPFASASFGQVHAAILNKKDKVIVKVQRPDIKKIVKIDFVLIDLISIFADIFAKIEALPWKNFAYEFKEWTLKELNYQIEAENAERIYENVSRFKNSKVIIPKTYHRLTTKKILVQDYIDGVPLSNILKEIKKGRINSKKLKRMGIDLEKAPRILATEMTREYLLDGFFHADPHPGNILLLQDGKIALLDYGIVGDSAPKRYTFGSFLKAGAEDRIKDTTYYFLDFAGDNLRQIVGSAIPPTIIENNPVDNLMRILAKHFCDYARNLEMKLKKDLEVMKIDYSVMVLQMIKYSQRYKIKIPKQMVGFIRALSILGFLAKKMDYSFKLTEVLQEYFQKYPLDLIPKKDINTPVYKRINREEAIEYINNWIVYLVEKDPELYQLINKFFSEQKFVVN